MSTIKRHAGITTVDFGALVIKTAKINRFEYNRLRKLKTIYPNTVRKILASKK
jgi:hypothetical protein